MSPAAVLYVQRDRTDGSMWYGGAEHGLRSQAEWNPCPEVAGLAWHRVQHHADKTCWLPPFSRSITSITVPLLCKHSNHRVLAQPQKDFACAGRCSNIQFSLPSRCTLLAFPLLFLQVLCLYSTEKTSDAAWLIQVWSGVNVTTVSSRIPYFHFYTGGSLEKSFDCLASI